MKHVWIVHTKDWTCEGSAWKVFATKSAACGHIQATFPEARESLKGILYGSALGMTVLQSDAEGRYTKYNIFRAPFLEI